MKMSRHVLAWLHLKNSSTRGHTLSFGLRHTLVEWESFREMGFVWVHAFVYFWPVSLLLTLSPLCSLIQVADHTHTRLSAATHTCFLLVIRSLTSIHTSHFPFTCCQFVGSASCHNIPAIFHTVFSLFNTHLVYTWFLFSPYLVFLPSLVNPCLTKIALLFISVNCFCSFHLSWILSFLLGHFFIRNMICSIKNIAFQTQMAHPVMYCLPNRIQIQTDPHIHAYLYVRKKRKLLHLYYLVRCWPLTSEKISQSFPTVAPRNTVLLLSKAVSCVWSPFTVVHDQRDHMCPHFK